MKFDTKFLRIDNFILNGGTHPPYYIQAFSSPSTILRVNSDTQLSLSSGASDVRVLPPDHNYVGVMLCIQVYIIIVRHIATYNNIIY